MDIWDDPCLYIFVNKTVKDRKKNAKKYLYLFLLCTFWISWKIHGIVIVSLSKRFEQLMNYDNNVAQEVTIVTLLLR